MPYLIAGGGTVAPGEPVTTEQIADHAVTGEKLAENSVTPWALAPTAVRTLHLFDAVVTPQKLHPDALALIGKDYELLMGAATDITFQTNTGYTDQYEPLGEVALPLLGNGDKLVVRGGVMNVGGDFDYAECELRVWIDGGPMLLEVNDASGNYVESEFSHDFAGGGVVAYTRWVDFGQVAHFSEPNVNSGGAWDGLGSWSHQMLKTDLRYLTGGNGSSQQFLYGFTVHRVKGGA